MDLGCARERLRVVEVAMKSPGGLVCKWSLSAMSLHDRGQA
jgi:hypothetical protein